MMPEYDVIVVGAGPSGSACAAFLGKAGRKVLLLDKAGFPRDKTCGDAISGSLKTQEELNLTPAVKKNPHAEIRRVVFSAPNGKELDVKFHGVGYTCRRQVYDNIIFRKAKKVSDVLENFKVTGLIREKGYVKGVVGEHKGKKKRFKADIVVGADGAHSVVAKENGLLDLDPKHTITAVRSY
jgi:flavin-dependent dehydrogenase